MIAPDTLTSNQLEKKNKHSFFKYIGDGPAVSEMCGTKRQGNAKVPCRFCHITVKLNYSRENYYVPHDAPELRSHLNLGFNLLKEIKDSVDIDDEEQRERGISYSLVSLNY